MKTYFIILSEISSLLSLHTTPNDNSIENKCIYDGI